MIPHEVGGGIESRQGGLREHCLRAAEWRAGAAGGRGVRRARWVCCPEGVGPYQGSLAEARHP
ncbi:MAG: hypothetical protein K9N47_22715, partial [Prosthecobacter sp.]|nr:hypothetical protein [Prosthecobacter sp.]